jgi:hypothetical protein
MTRFNLYLLPAGKIVLAGPEAWRVDESLNGLYLVLLRIEASDDKEADTDLASVGAGGGVVHGGAVAGFPLPVLRYYVANGSTTLQPATIAGDNLLLLGPENQATLDPDKPVDFTWSPLANAVIYRFEVEDLSTSVISAILPAGVGTYRAPSWFKDKIGNTAVRWRVVAFDKQSNQIRDTEWRALRFGRGSH